MHRFFAPLLPILLLGCGFILSSCETPDFAGPGAPPAPRVLMPAGLSQDEARYLPEIEDALIRNGLRPTRDRLAEYSLSFEIDDGPINADTHLILMDHGSEAARAYARVGSPRILLQRQEFIQQSFQKCLREFEAQLSRLGPSGIYRQRPDGGYRQSDRQLIEPTYDRSPGYESYQGYEQPY